MNRQTKENKNIKLINQLLNGYHLSKSDLNDLILFVSVVSGLIRQEEKEQEEEN